VRARAGHGVIASIRQSDRHFGLLLGLLVGTYLLSAFDSGYWIRALQMGLFLVVALIAAWTSRVTQRIKRLATVIVGVGSVVALAVTRATPDGPAAGAAFAWIALQLLVAVVFILRRVFTAREVTLQSIFGAISAYLVIGLMFSAVYGAISKFGGGPFFASGEPGNTQTWQYFSFVTLTTVGYGDFTAAQAGGRAVAVLEAVTGQVFLATLVARLVSSYRVPGAAKGGARHSRRPPSSARRSRSGNRRPGGGTCE
jgi:hypothetical protein